VSRLRAANITMNSVDARRNASARRFFSSRSEKTGIKAPLSAESANSDRTVFGIRKAIVNADAGPWTP
jgi:hypothetical protein